MKVAVAFFTGLLFGLGLVVSGMTSPAKVLAFLDVAGAWDPSLALVMGGAVLTAAPMFLLARRRSAPLAGGRFDEPDRRRVDARLVLGAILFGVGWGISGICPGPAVVNLAIAPASVLPFAGAMLAGIVVSSRLRRR